MHMTAYSTSNLSTRPACPAGIQGFASAYRMWCFPCIMSQYHRALQQPHIRLKGTHDCMLGYQRALLLCMMEVHG